MLAFISNFITVQSLFDASPVAPNLLKAFNNFYLKM